MHNPFRVFGIMITALTNEISELDNIILLSDDEEVKLHHREVRAEKVKERTMYQHAVKYLRDNKNKPNHNVFRCEMCNTERAKGIMLKDRPGVCVFCKHRVLGRAVVFNGKQTLQGKAFSRRWGKDPDDKTPDAPMYWHPYRRPYTGRDASGSPAKYYDKNTQFLSHEVSWFLNRAVGKFTWGEIISEDPEVILALLQGDYIDEETGEEYVCVFANWRDRGGKAILVAKAAGIKNLADLGVNTHLKGLNQSMKAAKYVNRLFAPSDERHVPVVGKIEEGSYIPETGECVVRINGKTLIVKFVDIDLLTPEEKAQLDGQIPMTALAHEVLGLSTNPTIGDSWKITLLPEIEGMAKGHSLFIPDNGMIEMPTVGGKTKMVEFFGMGADIVIPGPKKLVTGKEFIFMVIGELHSGNPNLDIQSVANFRLEKKAAMLARDVMRWIYNEVNTPMGMVNLLQRTLRVTEEDLENKAEDNIDIAAKADAWTLRRLMRLSLNPFSWPGSYRSAMRSVLKRLLRIGTFRIPMNLDPSIAVATSKYASGDPFARNEDGTVNMARTAIQRGEICIPDLPAGIWVIVYRQPNEHSKAWVKLKNVHYKQFMGARGKSVAFLGRGIDEVMAILGGGDLDDNLIIIHHPEWVKHFDTLDYPVQPKLAEPTKRTLDTILMDEDEWASFNFDEEQEEDMAPTFDEKVFGINHFDHQIREATKFGVLGIGPAVNVGMCDARTSHPDDIASMIHDLEERKQSPRAVDYLKRRSPWQAAVLMSNLELVIDAAVKDPELIRDLEKVVSKDSGDSLTDWVKKFHERTLVYPMFFAGAFGGTNRIPAKRFAKGGFVLARTEMCRAQENIVALKAQLEQVFARNEFSLMKRADPMISNLRPSNAAVKEFVHGKRATETEDEVIGLRGVWVQGWQSYFQAIQDNNGAPDDAVYSKVEDLINERLAPLDEQSLEAVAIEVYRFVYRNAAIQPPSDTTGRIQSFRDGLLWTSRLANAFMNVLHKEGLTGRMYPVNLLLDSHLNKEAAVPVRVQSSYIRLLTTGEHIGYTEAGLADGQYIMSYGLIQAKKAHPILMPSRDVFNDLIKL